LIVEYVYPRWLVRLRSSKDAKDELEALLRDTETRSRKYQVDANGKEVPGTSSYPDAEYWQDRLKLEPDDDGGDDHLVIDYAEYEDIYLPGRQWESVVRRLDVERHERLYFPMTAAPPPAGEQDVPARKPRLAAPPPAPATKGRGSRQQRMIQQIAAEEFPGGCDQIEIGVIIHRVGERLKRQRVPVPGRDTFNRALGRRKD
jgi:hypothetical protein